jgi:acyl-CoA thioesterase
MWCQSMQKTLPSKRPNQLYLRIVYTTFSHTHLSPHQIFHAMYANDAFSKWLGITLVQVGEGTCTLEMVVRTEMTNGFGVAHGGITFSLADSAFAFACNSHGNHAVSIDVSINHLAAVKVGDTLTATASEDHNGRSLGLYRIEVRNQAQKLVALFKGLCFRKETKWE